MKATNVVQTLACALVLAAATAVGSESDESFRGLRESLVASSVSDFAAHGPYPDQVRDVRVRYAEDDEGQRRYMLCGQFLPSASDSVDWTHFATIKTEPYEQWIGGQAEAICDRALPMVENTEDLSSVMQTQLELERPAR